MNEVDQLKALFDDIYKNGKAGTNNLKCLFYPIIKKLAEQASLNNEEWVSRDEIKSYIQKEFITDDIFGRSGNGGGVPLDHCWSQRFGKGEDMDLLNKLIEHDGEIGNDGKSHGDKKENFKLNDAILQKC